METLDKFRSGELMLLAASDVAARGLDIPDVSHIFNFDLPWQSDDYVHRIGRTGRAGKEGHSLSLVTADELKSLKDIEKMLGEPVVWIGEGPSEQDFAEAGKKRRRGRGGPQRGRGRGPAPSGKAPEKSRHGESRAAQRGPERKEARPERVDQRRQAEPRQAEPRREPRRQEQPRVEKQEPRRQAAPVRNGQPAPAAPRPERQPSQQRTGFADNVPAFLRTPVKRPMKVAGE
jgi:superfamily II DNA/RNA helicase